MEDAGESRNSDLSGGVTLVALWTVILFIPILLCKMQNLIIEKRGEGRRTLYTNWFPYQQTFTAVFFFPRTSLVAIDICGVESELAISYGLP